LALRVTHIDLVSSREFHLNQEINIKPDFRAFAKLATTCLLEPAGASA
jgi:hypothetical protein